MAETPAPAPALHLVQPARPKRTLRPQGVPYGERPIVHHKPAHAVVGGARTLFAARILFTPAVLDLQRAKEKAHAAKRAAERTAKRVAEFAALADAPLPPPGAAMPAVGAKRRGGAGRGAKDLVGAAVLAAAVQQLGRFAGGPPAPACADDLCPPSPAGPHAGAGRAQQAAIEPG